MLHRRLHRRVVAWLLAFCVLLAQTTAIAYACQRSGVSDPEAATPCASHAAADAGADAVPLAAGNVCEVHCQAASLPDAGAPDVPGPDAVVAWRLPPLLPATAARPPLAAVDARIASPPPRTLFARLLI